MCRFPTIAFAVLAIASPGLNWASEPEYKTIPAAPVGELTPAKGKPAEEEFRTWYRSHGNAAANRFSGLSSISRDNVKDLQLAWVYHSEDGRGNVQCNPVIVDGVIYAPTVGNHVVAINGETGREMWRFDPHGQPAFRGLIYWPGEGLYKPRLFFTAGAYLYALDPKTGLPVSGFGEHGRIRAGGGVVAPAIFKRTLVVPVESEVKAFNVTNGETLWTFNVAPADTELGGDTWSMKRREAIVWGGMAMDTDRGIAYIAVGAPHPNFIGVDRLGQNLFGDCVLALKADTGRYLWHFQEIGHDIWDLDIPAPPNLVTVVNRGKRVDAVAQVTKLGNTLLLDRVTGKPLFPVRLRRAPESNLPGEKVWPYQPAIDIPEPFARQVFTLDDVTDISAESRASVMKQIRNANFGWFQPFEEGKPTVFFGIHGGAEWTGSAFDPESGWLYVSSNELPWKITVSRKQQLAPASATSPGRKVYQDFCTGCHGTDLGGRGMAPPLQSLDRRYEDEKLISLIKTGRNAMPPFPSLTEQQQKDLLDFLFRRDVPKDAAPKTTLTRPQYTFDGYNKLLDQFGYPGSKPPWGTLNAINLNTGRIAWKVPLGEYEELLYKGLPRTGTENFGGPTVTAGGLVFCAGTRDNIIRAFNKSTGEELWRYKLPYGGFAPPAIYSVNGREYVVIASTGGGKLGGETGDAYVAFALPMKGKKGP